VDTLTGTITRLKGDLPRREAAVKKAEGAVAKRETAVAVDRKAVSARETAVAKREKAVGIVETTIQNNTVSDGVYQVGRDIKAGTYKTDGGSGCYYAVLGSANTNNIINNSFQDDQPSSRFPTVNISSSTAAAPTGSYSNNWAIAIAPNNMCLLSAPLSYCYLRLEMR
jgi:hypothetical protein